MIECGATAFEQAHAAMGVSGGRGDGGLKIGPADMMRAGAGDEKTAGAQHFESAEIQLLVAAERSFNGALGFGKGGGIENDGIERLACLGPVAEDLKGIGLDPIDLGG